VADRVRAEVAGRAQVVDWALDHALAQAAVLELVFPEDLAGVAASAGQDEVSSDRYS